MDNLSDRKMDLGGDDGDGIDESLDNKFRQKKVEKYPLTTNCTLLIRPRITEGPRGCANLGERKWNWGRFDSDFLKLRVHPTDNFLNKVAAICKRAGMKVCHNDRCVESKRRVESAAPSCGWKFFREWAVQSITCQMEMSPRKNGVPAHKHIAAAMRLFYVVLEQYYASDSVIEEELLGFNGSTEKLDIIQVVDVIYWALTVQYRMGYDSYIPNRWPDNLIRGESLPQACLHAEKEIERMELCKYRVNNLANASVRKGGELPAIVEALKKAQLKHPGHNKCTSAKCVVKYNNNNVKKQVHTSRCDGKCGKWTITREKLRKPIMSKPPVPAITSLWNKDTILLQNADEGYIAISHGWADGTGGKPDIPEEDLKGLDEDEMRKRLARDSAFNAVNTCYLEYFRHVAKMVEWRYRLKITGIWWDALSNLRKWGSDGWSDGLRKRAVQRMHENYRQAKVTIVHDKYLLGFKFSEFEDKHSACLAITMSPWFSRGWPALELNVSERVVVLFGGEDKNTPDLQDLAEILPHHPAFSLRGHWVASLLIQKVQRPIKNISHLLAVLHTRGTSWPQDIKLISALLVEWEGVGKKRDWSAKEAVEVEYTKGILVKTKKILCSALFHGFETIQRTGPFSWSPKALKDMPTGATDDFDKNQHDDSDEDGDNESDEQQLGDFYGKHHILTINRDGSIQGNWYYRFLEPGDTKEGVLTAYKPTIEPYGEGLHSEYRGKARISEPADKDLLKPSLRNWRDYLLLRDETNSDGPALLAAAVKMNTENDGGSISVEYDCRYIMTVMEKRPIKYATDDSRYELAEIRFGREGRDDVNARALFKEGNAEVEHLQVLWDGIEQNIHGDYNTSL
ncbi:hypothetical protein BDZ45DRAFT_732044 [Acephala macrosclerotiorum]|nr:hypothetical protein BDZ45DRAFT_732044 [Acephala macrosclerotiorum]